MSIERQSLEQVFREASPSRDGARSASRALRLPKLAPAYDEAPVDPTEAPRGCSFRNRPETSDCCAFMTVYVFNAAIMLFAFPVGFGLLVYNILGGENLRTTAHVMGLTGLMMTLPFLGASVPFLT